MRRLSAFLLTLIVAAGLAGPAAADRPAMSMTTIAPSGEQTLGITHRFHARDVMEILRQSTPVDNPDVTDLEHQARFALYVSENFRVALRDENGTTPVSTELIGAEPDGDYFFVYQEMPLPDEPRALLFWSALLKDLGDDWLSHINLETDYSDTGDPDTGGGESRIDSITFDGTPRWQPIAP